MSRYLDTSTKTQMAEIMVQHGRPSRSSGTKSVRSSFSRTVVGEAICERPIETWMGENSKLGMSLRSSWKRIILICVCDDIKQAGKKQNIDPTWKTLVKDVDLGEHESCIKGCNLHERRSVKNPHLLSTMTRQCTMYIHTPLVNIKVAPMLKIHVKDVDSGEPTSFLDIVHLGCAQRECKQAKTPADNHRNMFAFTDAHSTWMAQENDSRHMTHSHIFSSFQNTDWKKFQIGNASSLTEKEDYSYLCMWTIKDWQERNRTNQCGKYLWKTLIRENQHHSLTLFIWVALNENANKQRHRRQSQKYVCIHWRTLDLNGSRKRFTAYDLNPKISVGGSENYLFPGKTDANISSWSCEIEGHAEKCVERYCELANKITQQ